MRWPLGTVASVGSALALALADPAEEEARETALGWLETLGEVVVVWWREWVRLW